MIFAAEHPCLDCQRFGVPWRFAPLCPVADLVSRHLEPGRGRVVQPAPADGGVRAWPGRADQSLGGWCYQGRILAGRLVAARLGAYAGSAVAATWSSAGYECGHRQCDQRRGGAAAICTSSSFAKLSGAPSRLTASPFGWI
jgi:hypothetical protein